LKRSPIKKVSGKKAKKDAVYSTLRKKFLEDKPVCEICASARSTDIHHKFAGADRNKYQNDTSTWMSLCRICHDYIHQHPKESREKGWLK